jgi:hypothetical protein
MKVHVYLKCCFGIETYGQVDEDLVKWKCEVLCCNSCEYEDYFLMVMTQCGLKNIYQLLEECRDRILKEKTNCNENEIYNYLHISGDF